MDTPKLCHCGKPVVKPYKVVCSAECSKEFRKKRGKTRNRIWRAANQEKQSARSRRRRSADPEKARAYARLWYSSNPEKGREAARRRRQADPEKHSENVRRWKETHPEMVLASERRSNSRKALARLRYRLIKATQEQPA